MSICNQVDIDTSRVVSGFEIDNLSDDDLKRVCEECNVFVRMTPLQKNKIINILQANGHVVGYMGDGVNDAPSLRSADVGISVNTATEIARTSSDIILLEKDLMVLKDGVITGRKIFGNIIKYMKMTLSSNFGNMFSVLVGSIFLPFLPMIPIQILIQNMLYDLSQTSLPWDDVDNDFLIKPQKWDIGDLERYMKSIGIISSIYDGVTYLILWFVLGYNKPELQSYFQTGWFMEGLISQTLIVYFIRTSKIPFVESSPNRLVTLTTLIVVLCAIVIPFLPFANSLGFIVPNYEFYLILPGILILYFLSIEIVKTGYIKKYHKWL
jgi:Mg2+-importing ATPase